MVQIKRSELKKLAQDKLGDDSIESQNKILIMISTAICARTSYTLVGDKDKRNNYEAELALHDKLLESGHMSPFEHCAKAMTDREYSAFTKSEHVPFGDSYNVKYEQGICRNFKGFIQYRHLIENKIKT